MIRFLILLIIAAICGSIGAAIAGSKTRGCITSIILGFIGALIGNSLSQELNIPDFIYVGKIPVFWSIIGAALFVAIIGLISGRNKK